MAMSVQFVVFWVVTLYNCVAMSSALWRNTVSFIFKVNVEAACFSDFGVYIQY
jgi:hypothetical protein